MVSIYLLLLLYISTIDCRVYELWSAEQLDDMILSDAYKKSVPARSPAVIALYETECRNKLYREFGFTSKNLPNSMSMVYAVFDRKMASSNIWYEWIPEIMDLFIRYNVSRDDQNDVSNQSEWCPTIIWQGADWNKPIKIYNHPIDQSFTQWVWTNLVIDEITFINPLDKDANLVIKETDNHDENMINEIIIAQISKKENVTIKYDENEYILHAGDTIHVIDNDHQVINRYLLDTVTKQINISQSKTYDMLNDVRYDKWMQHKSRLRMKRDWNTRKRYLNNNVVPKYIPQFTDIGYKYVDKIPKEICDYLLELVDDNKSNRKVKERFPRFSTLINANEVPLYKINIPNDKKQWIGEKLKGRLEEWSGTKLEWTRLYGIREYTNGAVLKTHCDRVETHIISAIMHINHSPINASWPIEVVSFVDGKRAHILNEMPCSMTFYESAKLIHGRPFTYNGISWTNAFLHYKPVDWIGYEITPENILVTPEQSNIPLENDVYG